jgi:hypothetical protein
MILSCSQFWVIITWLESLVLVLVWLGKIESEMVGSLDSVLELGIKLDLVLKPELEPNLDQNQNWFFSQIMLLGTKNSFKSVRDI